MSAETAANAPQQPKVPDLMAALKASLEEARKQPAERQDASAAGVLDLERLKALYEIVKPLLPPSPLVVEYDFDGNDSEWWRWAWRIPGVVNFVEEAPNNGWPPLAKELVTFPESGEQEDSFPEYLALLLNVAPALVARVEALTEELRAARDSVAKAREARGYVAAARWLAEDEPIWAEVCAFLDKALEAFTNADAAKALDPSGQRGGEGK